MSQVASLQQVVTMHPGDGCIMYKIDKHLVKSSSIYHCIFPAASATPTEPPTTASTTPTVRSLHAGTSPTDVEVSLSPTSPREELATPGLRATRPH